MNMRKIYRQIAKKNGVSVAEVKRGIQATIDAAYENPSFHAQCVYRAGDKPTPEEFIAHMARRVQINSRLEWHIGHRGIFYIAENTGVWNAGTMQGAVIMNGLISVSIQKGGARTLLKLPADKDGFQKAMSEIGAADPADITIGKYITDMPYQALLLSLMIVP